jgi:hypothetical protein
VALRRAAILGAAIGQDPAQRDLLLVEEGNHPVIEQIGGYQRGLAIIELGKCQLRVGIGESVKART